MSLRLSVHNVEEVAALYSRDPDEAREQIRLMMELADLRWFFREPRELVLEAIVAATAGVAPPSPYVSDAVRLRAALGQMAIGEIEDLPSTIEATAEQIQAFRDAMNAGRDKWEEIRKQFPASDRTIPFQEYFARSRVLLAEDMFKRLALPPVAPGEAEGLLRIPYTRAYIDASASLLYAYSFEGRHADQGDSRDLMHAAVAAYADLFVLNDARFFRVLKRIPDRPFEVATLAEFLEVSRPRSSYHLL